MAEASNKKLKSGKSHGWEEAGAEFYQESYSSDWDGCPKDTFAIRTLLPSKQTRLVTCKETISRAQELRNTKYWQSLASTTHKCTKTNETQFSTLPDLSQVHTDEERIWEEILQIKLLPVAMHQKKFLKSNLQNATKLRLQGFTELKWKHRKVVQRIGVKWSEIMTKFKLWHSSLKQIEGHFGTGVVAYFLLVRWLFILNCLTFLLVLAFTILPNYIAQQAHADICKPETAANQSDCYEEINPKPPNFLQILQVVQGSGALQSSLMYYGAYSNEVLGEVHNQSHNANPSIYRFYYDLPLAYVFVTMACFAIILIAIVRATAREFKHHLIEGNQQSYQYCNLIFSGWDYCIQNQESANIKHSAVYSEITCLLQYKSALLERSIRSKNIMYKLILIRFVVNLAVITILSLSAYLIYVLFNISLDSRYSVYNHDSDILFKDVSKQNDEFYDDMDSKDVTHIILHFLFDFMPYIAIVCLNLFLPLTFNYLCRFERYSPLLEIKVSLLRTVFLRLASLVILLSRFYCIVIPQSQNSRTCWETFIGQQFFKLVITDFIIHLLVTLCINVPRAICARKFNNSFIKFIGEQEFELPKHVLDIVYIQTVCWLGSFYTPFLSIVVAIIIFGMFYLKKFQCLYNSIPSKIYYGVSRSKSMFMLVLLISYFLAVIPIFYAIAEIKPSTDCGPFKGLNSVWEAPLTAFEKMPKFIQNIIYFFGTAGFSIPCFIVLLLLLYYFYAISDANRNMVSVLKNQLVLEGHDKQFLLNRLSVFLKQHQETQGKNFDIMK